MALKPSGEMYLESIFVLSKTKSAVRSIDIAEHMNFSKPSVSRAVGLLKEQNYIAVDKDGYIVVNGVKTEYNINFGDNVPDESFCTHAEKLENIVEATCEKTALTIW